MSELNPNPPNSRTFPKSAWLQLAREFGAVLAMAALYFVAGRLALLLAIPPGYATAVWPAAGLALAAVLRFGYRLTVGVWLGSFLVNVWTSLDPSSAATLWKSIAVAGGIGAGAALQAAFGAMLIRRFLGRQNALEDGRSVTTFLLLGGPAACVVNAVVGVTTLYLSGILALSTLAFSIATWWVGDMIGVLIFAPLGMLALSRGATARSRLAPIIVPLGFTFAAVVALFFAASRWEQERLTRGFSRRATAAVTAVSTHFDDYLGALHSISALYGSSNSVERDEFANFTADLRARYEGMEGISWDPRVPGGQRAAFEAARRAEGFAMFEITEFDAQGAIVRAAERPEYFPILFREPLPIPGRTLGFDAGSDPDRQAALHDARDSGQARATTARLISDPSHRTAVIAYQPVYFRGAPRGTVEERRQNLEGFAAGVFRIRDMMTAALREVEIDGMQFRLWEDDAAGTRNLLLTYPETQATEKTSGSVQSATIDLAGLRCVLECALTTENLVSQRSWVGWVVLAGGLVLTSLLGGFLLVITGRSSRVEELVTQRTAELDEANQSLHTHVAEKEVLLQEIHHRVKNNLQVVCGLLQLQAGQTQDPAIRALFKESENRVKTMALVHQTLYESDLAHIDFGKYAEKLTTALFRSFNVDPRQLTMALDTGGVQVTADVAVPCGLIINELITNALKYAFPESRTGNIRVALTRERDDHLSLMVSDDGIGLPAGIDVRKSTTLGLRLVTSLAGQLGGTIEHRNGVGTRWKVTFRAADRDDALTRKV
jgi:two-component sensor histidine kinase/integral membrane sensor domain MASE1